MKKKTKDVLEKQLWHGTKHKSSEAICRQNFDFRISGSNVGTLYGQGSYFHRQANYSNSYTELENDVRRMFLARVLVGSYATGDKSLKRPPPIDPSNPLGDLHDSCVDDDSDPSIFVIFDTSQAYPEYLIEYNNSHDPVTSHTSHTKAIDLSTSPSSRPTPYSHYTSPSASSRPTNSSSPSYNYNTTGARTKSSQRHTSHGGSSTTSFVPPRSTARSKASSSSAGTSSSTSHWVRPSSSSASYNTPASNASSHTSRGSTTHTGYVTSHSHVQTSSHSTSASKPTGYVGQPVVYNDSSSDEDNEDQYPDQTTSSTHDQNNDDYDPYYDDYDEIRSRFNLQAAYDSKSNQAASKRCCIQ